MVQKRNFWDNIVFQIPRFAAQCHCLRRRRRLCCGAFEWKQNTLYVNVDDENQRDGPWGIGEGRRMRQRTGEVQVTSTLEATKWEQQTKKKQSTISYPGWVYLFSGLFFYYPHRTEEPPLSPPPPNTMMPSSIYNLIMAHYRNEEFKYGRCFLSTRQLVGPYSFPPSPVTRKCGLLNTCTKF